ncbi:MAG: hypothetical protein M0O96_04365 [Desulforhopalus sp.]|nr:hypothetical protein [Desulforhopalus sp.]
MKRCIRGEALLVAAGFMLSLSGCGGRSTAPQPGPAELQSRVDSASHADTTTAAAAMTAPGGYSWQVLPTCFVLQPDGWEAKVTDHTQNGVRHYYWATSPEDFSAERPFETGFSVEILFGGGINGTSADALAATVLTPWYEKFGKKMTKAELYEESAHNGYRMYRFQYEDTSATPVLKVQKYLVADSFDFSVTIFTFESPVEEWGKNWGEFGQMLMDNVGL